MELVEHKVDNSAPCTCERTTTTSVINLLLSESFDSVQWQSESRRKRSTVPSVGVPVVDEERMRPGNWTGSVLYFFQCFDTVGLVAGRTSRP